MSQSQNESAHDDSEDSQERKHWFDVYRAFATYEEFLELDVSTGNINLLPYMLRMSLPVPSMHICIYMSA